VAIERRLALAAWNGRCGGEEPVGGDNDGAMQSSGRAPSDASGLSMVLKF
jgi:hypothetical protein